jgi:GNAT superfamily N-acetyltransferase
MEFTIKNITTELDLDKALAFNKRVFENAPNATEGENAKSKWLERMASGSNLLLYAEVNNEVIGIVFGRTEANGSITVGPVATDARVRKKGIARQLLYELEKRALAQNVHLLALGSVEAAEGFYLKCGYTASLLVQDNPPVTLDDLRRLNTSYPEAWCYDDGADIRLCIFTNGIDRALQHAYGKIFPNCSTQTLMSKFI